MEHSGPALSYDHVGEHTPKNGLWHSEAVHQNQVDKTHLVLIIYTGKKEPIEIAAYNKTKERQTWSESIIQAHKKFQ